MHYGAMVSSLGRERDRLVMLTLELELRSTQMSAMAIANPLISAPPMPRPDVNQTRLFMQPSAPEEDL
ncbi:hypothetical protein Rleg5DRAFT_1360 [Rhizobium leguminosarum bv. viciae WSM1455]|nr:hypothetical protein Rleg5DRAFT_1360 [Rhizobium leguminosarum bv. viciae WSM1455]